MTFITSFSGQSSRLGPHDNHLSRSAGKVFFIACFTIFALITFTSSRPPLFMDYPDWVYQGVLFGRVLSGHPVSGYTLKHYPVPNTISTIGLGLLSLAFGWAMAARLWVILYLTVACATGIRVIKIFGIQEWSVWWILPGVLFFSRAYWLGTVNFDLGLCVFLLLACVLYQRQERSLIVVGLLVLCFFLHLIAYAAALLLTVLYCLQHRSWKLASASLITLPLVGWYAAGRIFGHGNESALGSSPFSHLSAMVLALLLILMTNFFRPRQSILGMVVPCLIALSTLTGLAAFASILLFLHRTASVNAGIIILQDKVFALLSLGFVNMRYSTSVVQKHSTSEWHFLHFVFATALVLAAIAGSLLLVAIARSLSKALAESRKGEEDAIFVWNFVAIVALLYLVCPPNALGVIGIDLRLAQLACGSALFLVGRYASIMLRISTIPVVLFTIVNIYQFSALQSDKVFPPTIVNLPGPLARCCNIDPLIRLEDYDHLKTDELNDTIFPTGIFMQSAYSHQ